MIDVPLPRFEELVADALDSLPEDLGRLMDNVWVTVEDDSGEGLLGLYDGIPLTARDTYGGLAVPDRIVIYRHPICRMSSTTHEVVAVVRETVIHEIAHHFGIDDDRLEELGWD